MSMFRGKARREVVVYSMGRDGSSAVHTALSIAPQIHARQVYTLDPGKIANMNLREDDVPDHIAQSDQILRHDLSGNVPHYFITMVHDPFARHIRQCFHVLRHRVEGGNIGHTLANARAMQSHFASIPAAQTTQWFHDEYLPATGIDVFEKPFDHALGYQEFDLGIHRLLLLSAHLPQDRQAEVISGFVDAKIPPILPERSSLDGMRDVFMAQILASMREQVISDFWYTRFARHFFSPDQIGGFQAQGEELARQIMAMQDTIDALQNAGTREHLLQDALSPFGQVPQLTAELSALAAKRGYQTVLSLTESLLRQMQRAQNNLLLSAVRALDSAQPQLAVDLGERWMIPPQDDRLVRSLTKTMQRAAAITRPLQLLESMPRDEKQEQHYRRLKVQQHLLGNPFTFSPRAARPYTPMPKTVLYNPHQALPFHGSGYATRTHGLTRALRGCGYDLQLVVRAGYPTDTHIDANNTSRYEQDGVLYRFDPAIGQGQWDLPFDRYVDRAAEWLVKHALSFRPGILHTASNYVCGMGGIEAARRLGIPSLYEMRGLWHITQWSKDDHYAATDKFALAQKMELQCAEEADHVLAITGALKEWLVEHGIESGKITVAPNAVDLTQFKLRAPDAEFAKIASCENKIVIGYIGSFVQYEGLDLLLQAVAKMPGRLRARIRLLWLGDGPALPGLLQQAVDLGIADMISALGRRPFEDVPRAYSIVDIAVFPRKGQAVCEIVSPLKPFEAMAMGKIVIASDVRPLKEIIDHGITGLLHQKDNADDLAIQLSRAIEDRKLRENLGTEARKWVSETRDWQRIAQTVCGVYEGLA